MKLLRRISVAFMCLLLCILCAFTAFAESVSYKIDRLGLTVEFPKEMTVKTLNPDYEEGKAAIYLEAKSPSEDFSITITMKADEDTKSIGELSSLQDSAIEDFKNKLEAEERMENSYTEGIRRAEYNGSTYIDLSQKQYLKNDVVSYISQSVTIKNGMGIYIHSVSVGDNFTTEELSIIKDCLESISFEAVNKAEKNSVWTVILWILIGIILLCVLFFGFVLFMRMRNKKRRRTLQEEAMNKGNYRTRSKSSGGGTVGGFRTSSDYFLEGYDREEKKPSKPDSTALTSEKKAKEGAITRTGYFFKNLKKEIKKSGRGKSSKKSTRPQSKDYDVFRDR